MKKATLDPYRPKTAFPMQASRPRQYRLNDTNSLDTIHSNITKTFSNDNRSWRDVRDLTLSRLSPQHSQRINRMCVQYSIIPTPRKFSGFSSSVDVETIAQHFIKNKSREMQREEQRQKMKRSVGKVGGKKKKQPKPFFHIDHDVLRNMEIKAKKKGIRPSKDHPYIALYEKSQSQALANLTDGNSLDLGVNNLYPPILQPEEWQRDHFQVRNIYTGIRQFRSTTAKQREPKKVELDNSNFYLT